ncbi:MAG: Ger(x)C family spore germination protein [Clostridium perfringens]|nr:Ger(x)C family spore germination protein [Clostridium perfringens]
MKQVKNRLIKLLSLVFLFIIVIGLKGCYDYTDINDGIFVTTIIFDENEVGEIEIYLDAVKPYRSANETSQKGEKIVYKGTGKTVGEAMKDVNLTASGDIDFSQCKAYIFTEQVSKEGIKKFMDAINRNQEFMIRPYMFVLFGSPNELLNQVKGDEEYLGIYLEQLIRKMNDNPKVIAINANQYLAARTNYNNIAILGALNIKNINGEKTLDLSGGALFEDEVMVRKISTSEGMSYNFLTGKVESGTLEAINPQNTNSFVTLGIQNSKTKTSISYNGERINLYKKIIINCYLEESQSRLMVDEDVLDIIKYEEESMLNQYIQMLFTKFKNDGLDIANVGTLFEQKYPDETLNVSPLTITDLDLDIEININGASKTSDTF